MITTDTQRDIEALLADGQLIQAADMTEAVLARGEVHPALLSLVSWRLADAGDMDSAFTLLRRAVTLAPSDPHVLTALGRLFRMAGVLSRAVRAFDAAIAVNRLYYPAWLERGMALASGGSWRLAAESFRQVVSIDAAVVAAWSGLADIAAAQGDNAAARECAERALALDPGDGEAICALARSEIASGDPAQGRERIVKLLATDPQADDRVIEPTLVADADDKLGNTEAAFQGYARAKRNFARRFRPQLAPRGETQAAYIETIRQRLAATGMARAA